MTATITETEPFTGRIAWAHDVRTDPRLPTALVADWLAANGILAGRTVRIEITADRQIRWWELEPIPSTARCCLTPHDAYRDHLQGPRTTPLVAPLPAALATRDGA